MERGVASPSRDYAGNTMGGKSGVKRAERDESEHQRMSSNSPSRSQEGDPGAMWLLWLCHSRGTAGQETGKDNLAPQSTCQSSTQGAAQLSCSSCLTLCGPGGLAWLASQQPCRRTAVWLGKLWQLLAARLRLSFPSNFRTGLA